MRSTFILLLISCFAFYSRTCLGQAEGSIEGRVVDEKLHPVQYSVVRLEQRGQLAPYAVVQSDSAGRFAFTRLPAETYVLKIDGLGYLPYTSAPIQLGSIEKKSLVITLQENLKTLGEVKVTATKPLIERLVDKTVVNIDGNPVAAGNNVLEVLSLSPGVIVNNGQIMLNGKTGVNVMIDGKPTYLAREALNAYLKTMNASEVKQLELITNPSARYDATGTGGIINIVTKREANNGLQLTLYGGVGYGYYPRNNQSANLSYRNQLLTAFVAYSHSTSNNYEWVDGYRRFDSSTTFFGQRNRNKIAGENHLLRTGVLFSLGKHNELGVQFKTNWYGEYISQSTETNKQAKDIPDSLFVTNISTYNTLRNYSINVNYKLISDSSKNQLSANIDQAHFTINPISDYLISRYQIDNTYLQKKTSLYSNFPYQTDIYTAKVDYEHTINRQSRIEGGVKTSYVNTLNTLEYYNTTGGKFDLDITRSNVFRYKEYVHAAYASAQHSSNGFDIQAGVRAEYTITRGESYTIGNLVRRNYLNLFPSFSTAYSPSEKHRLSISYSRRIARPSYKDLNPFNYYLDPFSSLQGNPYLTPQYSNSIELSHSFKNTFTTTISYSHTVDVIMQVPDYGITANSYILKPANISTFNSLGLLIGFPFKISTVSTSNFTFNVYQNSYKQNSGADLAFLNNTQTSFEFNFDNQIKLPHGVVMTISGYYLSPFVQGYYKTAGIFTANAGLKRTFLKQKLDVKLNVNDIFKSYKSRTTSYFDGQTLYLNQVFNTRFINLSFSYRFVRGAKITPLKANYGSQDEQQRVK